MSEEADNDVVHDEVLNGDQDVSTNDSEYYSGEQEQCHVCSKSVFAEDFQLHLQICKKKTTNRLPKPCPFCGKEFSLSNLSRHIKQVHKKIEEACPVCGKFISKANLSKHVRYVHKVSLEDWGKLTDEQAGQLRYANGTITPNKTVKRKSEDDESPDINGSEQRMSGRKRKRNDYYEDGEESNEDYALPTPTYSDQPEQLRAISRPKLSNHNQYSVTPGYRIVDMTLMRTALKASQRCGHNSITVAETSDASDHQEDLATILAFVCEQCGTQTVFANSAFSDESPANYLLNKTMLPLLGEEGYCSLSQVVQCKDGAKPLEVEVNSDTLDTELVMSTANSQQSGLVCEPEIDDLLIKEEPADSDEEMDESEENDNDAATPFVSAVKEEEAPVSEPSKSKMKVFPVPGGMLTPIPPGTKISSSNVTRTTTSEVEVMFGDKFPAGVYRFSSLMDGSQSIFIIREDGGEVKKKKEPSWEGKRHHKYQPLVDQPYPAWKKKGHQLGGKKCAKPSVSTAISKAGKTRKTPLEFFSKEVKEGMMKRDPELTEDDVTKKIIDRWIKMTNEEKMVYRNMVLNPPDQT